MSKFAWVTLTTNDTYSLGALVLAHSLRRAGTAHQLAVLVTPSVSESMRDKLKDVYNVVQEVNVLDSEDAANLALLARPELGITFTKLHCWRLVQFEKCVFLDADTMVLQNCDELFEREELSAAPDVSWPDCFNSGVFVFQPSLDTFGKITAFAAQHGSFDGGDQGLLNSYFADWAHTDIKKHLPFVYNVTAYASYCYLPAFKQFRDKIKILHFAGKMKPWLVQFNSENKTASTPTDYAHASDLVQLWWNIFCDNVHENLSDTMNYWPLLVDWSHCEMNNHHNYYHENVHYHQERDLWRAAPQANEPQTDTVTVTENVQQHQYPYDFVVKDFHDPWEDYYENLANEQTLQTYDKQPDILTHAHDADVDIEADVELEEVEIASIAATIAAAQQTVIENTAQELAEEHSDENHRLEMTSVVTSTEDTHDEPQAAMGVTAAPPPHASANAEAPNNIEAENEAENAAADEDAVHQSTHMAAINCCAELAMPIVALFTHAQHTIDCHNELNEAGLAGALSQLRLGVQRTPEQEAYEQMMRRQCWESGQIDYAGKDSFDNIWKRITQTLEEKPTAAGAAGAAAAAAPQQQDDKSGSA